MVNLLSDKGFRREWIQGIGGLNDLEFEIFKLIEDYRDTRDERLRIFHLIQIWGGFSGRNIYLNPDNGFDWDVIDIHYLKLINSCRRIKDHSENSQEVALKAIQEFNKNVKYIGIPFITKHVRFWLYDSTGNRMLPIYDSVMAQGYMGQKRVNYKDLKAYWVKMIEEAKQQGLSLAAYERREYNRIKSIVKSLKKVDANRIR
jgi:hypothetical protein